MCTIFSKIRKTKTKKIRGRHRVLRVIMHLCNLSENRGQWKQWIFGGVRVLYVLYTVVATNLPKRWAWTGFGVGSELDFDLFRPDRIGAGLGFSAGSDRSRIV